MRQYTNNGGAATRLALRLAMAVAMMGSWPVAQAAAGPVDAANAAAEPSEDANPAAEATEAGAAASAADASDAAAQTQQDVGRPRHGGVSPLDRRVNLLAAELGLDARQRAQVKKLLEGQREQVARVWNDESIPAARRVSATQVISDRTADQIRALLTDDQRKKYIQPRKREVAVGTAGGDVESLMKSGKRN